MFNDVGHFYHFSLALHLWALAVWLAGATYCQRKKLWYHNFLSLLQVQGVSLMCRCLFSHHPVFCWFLLPHCKPRGSRVVILELPFMTTHTFECGSQPHRLFLRLIFMTGLLKKVLATYFY